MNDETEGRGPKHKSKTDTDHEERVNLGQKEANLQTKSKAKLARMRGGRPEVTKSRRIDSGAAVCLGGLI
jgi:hypothetical protein